jgi:glyoxylase-like metal-dependent hydrolase (beta-lactamase superfamily II)
MEPRVTVIRVGTLCLEPSELPGSGTYRLKQDLGIGGGSTVTLIQSDRTILVDTGFDYESLESEENAKLNADALLAMLRLREIEPQDIDVVFLTHGHRDHTGNLWIFPKARTMATFQKALAIRGEQPASVADNEEIAKGVRVIFTPGHTEDHASLIVDGRVAGVKARVAVAGDAVISYSYFASGTIWSHNGDFCGKAEARRSISRLVEASDIIIPGHGSPFTDFRPSWLKAF